MFKVPNQYRVKDGAMGSTDAIGLFGCFKIPVNGHMLNVIASKDLGWEHVSCSTATQIPSWTEMCVIKDFFWDSEDVVIQFHPPKSEYINHHPRCLHLWRKEDTNDFVERPPVNLIGPR